MKQIIRWAIRHPQLLLLVISLLVLWRVLALGHLTYGDIPYFDTATSKVNFLYAWGSEQLGTPVRQSLNTVRDVVLQFLSPLSIMYYLLKYVMPLLLIPQVYFWMLSRLGIRSRAVLLLGSLFPLFTPIVFGDFLTGQTFWVYLTVPFVLFYAIKLFVLRQFTLRNDVLLALWLFLSLGMLPPIIVPLMAVVALFAFVMLLVHATPGTWRTVIVDYIICGLRVGVIFGLMALPYMLIASSGQAAYTSPSLLGDYYHNYAETHLLNTLRMAGNNGSGQSTLGFNDWSLTNVVGYVLTAIMIGGGVVLGLKQKMSRYWATLIGLLAVLLVILGFMQLLTINTLFGTRVFESQWLVSTVRNPSKLYVILLPIFTLLFTFGLGNIVHRYGKNVRQYRAILIVCALAMSIYGWPALRGDLGLLAGREDAAASYKQDPVTQAVARSQSAQKGRVLLLPANHRDELNYEFLNPNLNLLRLEGSLPGSAETIDALNDALNTRNPYFFRYLSALGVKSVFVKKDEAAYQQALFDLFSVRLSPQQTHDFLTSELSVASETNDYWEFANPKASDMVYSPQNITYIKDGQTGENNAPFFVDKNTAVVPNSFGSEADYATGMQAKNSLAQGDLVASGIAQLHDPSLLVADVYRSDDSGAPEAIFEILNPVDMTHERTVRVPLGADDGLDSVVNLGENDYIITPEKQRVTLRSGDFIALVSRLRPTEIPGVDTSFEMSSVWRAGDASPKAKGTAAVRAAGNPDATDGSQSLEVSSAGHKAFVSMTLPKLDDDQRYMLQFDYKHLSGSVPSFGIYQAEQSLLPAEGGLTNNDDWTRQTVFFAPTEGSDDTVQFYFYTTGSATNQSRNLIDAVRLYQINDKQMAPTEIASSKPDYPLKNYQVPQLVDSSVGQNLLGNGSFEDDSLWGKVGDATSGAMGDPVIAARQTADHSDGKFALELSSHSHTAYVAKRVNRFVPNTVYKLSFDYKHVEGRQASFAVWQDGAAVSSPAAELENGTGEWTHYETFFVPDPQATNLTAYLYAPSNGEQTTNLYDNVRLEATSFVSTYLAKQAAPKQQPTQLVESFERVNPTTIKVRARPGAGLLVFNESYHQGWQAYVGGKRLSSHQVVNGFASGWWIDDTIIAEAGKGQTYEVVLKYEPQDMLYIGLGVMAATIVAVVTYLGINSWRSRRGSA